MTHLRHFWSLLLAGFVFLSPAHSQTPEELAQLDPSDLYFQGWMLNRDAEKLIQKGKHLDAYAKLKKAKAMFDTVAVNHATYRPNLVKGRQKSINKTMTAIYDKATAEQEKQNQNTKGLIEGEGAGDNLIVPLNQARETERIKNINELQREIDQLKKSLASALNDRDANAAKLRHTMKELQAERNRLAAAPLKSQLDELNAQIVDLRRERDAMSLALDKTRAKHRETLHELNLTQQALAASRKKVQDFLAVIEEQRKINGRVTKGQQDQIDQLRREMKKKDGLLTDANIKIQELTIQLNQSQALVSDLKEERDGLLKEKEEMDNLLKMNAADRVQKLLSQNVSLSKNLNEANRKLEAVSKSANANKDDIILAKRGLVVAKARIRETQRQNKQYELRIRDLEKRLKQAHDDILARAESGDLSEADQEEMAMLRDIAKSKRDQLKAQQKKGELLVAQAKRMGIADPAWSQAVAQFNGSLKPAFTEDEEAIIADTHVDYTANSRFQPSVSERRKAAENLKRRTSDLNKVAVRLFAKDDLQAARGILGMIIEEDPGAWDALMNLGIVQLRLDQPTEAAKQFQEAILYAGDRKIPLAHFMLGDAYYRNDLFEDAQREINLSLTLDPENAEAHVLLGNMAGKLGQATDAEIHFKEAIKIDPNIWEPHFNLAYMAERTGNKTEALIYYQEALRRGAPANLSLEKKLGL